VYDALFGDIAGLLPPRTPENIPLRTRHFNNFPALNEFLWYSVTKSA